RWPIRSPRIWNSSHASLTCITRDGGTPSNEGASTLAASLTKSSRQRLAASASPFFEHAIRRVISSSRESLAPAATDGGAAAAAADAAALFPSARSRTTTVAIPPTAIAPTKTASTVPIRARRATGSEEMGGEIHGSLPGSLPGGGGVLGLDR